MHINAITAFIMFNLSSINSINIYTVFTICQVLGYKYNKDTIPVSKELKCGWDGDEGG